MNQVFEVIGMTCGHCEKAVSQALLKIDPQAQVSIDRASNHVQVSTDKARAQLAEAIESEGYKVTNA
jgi:copper chaperone